MPSDGHEKQVCQNCGDRIDGQPLYHQSDITAGEDGLEFVDDPDGPFCSVNCRGDHDGE